MIQLCCLALLAVVLCGCSAGSPAPAPGDEQHNSIQGDLYVNPSDGGVLRLARKGDAWEEAGAIKQRRIVHRMVATPEGRLVVLGGANAGDNIAVTETVMPSAARKP